MIHNYCLEYDNVVLRPLSENDIEYLRNWRNIPENTRFLSKIPYITKDNQINWYKHYLGNNNEIVFSVYENSVLNRLVGSISLYDFENDSCYLGKFLIGDSDAHGKKVGVNACIAAKKIAFEQLNINDIKLLVYSDNIAAYKTYIQAGFSISEEHISSDGKLEYLMSVNRGDLYD